MVWCTFLVICGCLCLVTRPLLVNAQNGQPNDSGENGVTRCGQPPSLENGSFDFSGNHVFYGCNGQYMLFGSRKRRCWPSGKWGGTAPVCSARGCAEADAPPLPNSSIKTSNFDTVLVYHCHAGFTSQGQANPMAYCDGNRWRHPLSRCVREVPRSSCGPAPSIANAVYKVQREVQVTYTCALGYVQRLGDAVIRCGTDGQWTGSPAVCTRFGCSLPRVYDIQNGFISWNPSRDVLNIRCLGNYKMQGSSVLFCDGRNWNGTLPSCTAPSQSSGYPALVERGTSCGTVPIVDDARYSYYPTQYDSAGNPFYAIRYQCSSGYTLQPANYAVYCSGGNIVGTPPNCLATCGYSNGGCQHICRNAPQGAVCSCLDGYHLATNLKTCQDVNECATNGGKGPCDHLCYNSPTGSFTCQCHSGYSLASNKISCLRNQAQCNCGPGGRCIEAFGTDPTCRCNVGYRLSNDRLSCLKRQCSCGDGSSSCTEISGVKKCTCDRGYRVSPDGTRCNDIDECQESGNGFADCEAACQNTRGSYYCSCPGNWRRLAADRRTCQDIPCSCGEGSVSCSQPNGQKICTCADGYHPSRNGDRCIDRNECEESSPCQGECTNTRGSYYCRCSESGYQLASDRHSCQDIDECQRSASHNCQHVCVNIPGSYRCDCPPGHFLMPDGISCRACRPNSYRSAIANECLECPVHSRTVGRGKASIEDCICLPGFSGDFSRDEECKDIDECEQDNGGCKNHCINTPGSFYCACPDGYTMMDDGKTCADRDECAQSNAGCQHTCINTEGSFRCECNLGYAVNSADSYLCVDVDECATDRHNCQHICSNFPGGFHCQCRDNFRLARDGSSCNAVTCSPLVVTEIAKISPKDLCLGNHATNQITVGTVCKLSCKRGHVLQGASNRTCMSTGRWSGQPTTCTPVQCPALQPPNNGQVSPPSCLLDGGKEFKDACAYSCDEGYTTIGSSFTSCQANGEWSSQQPTCREVSEITCPRDVSVALEQGASHAVINLPKPVHHTLDRLEASVPSVGHSFLAGVSTVIYTARSNTTETSASCSFDVIVRDEESPVFEFCPESLTINTQEQYPQIQWQTPVATDNVGVVENTTWISPEGRFTWGTYTVLIDVHDAAGNSDSCKFSISIQTVECGTPNGPLNGDSGCSDWMFGKICEPRCSQSHYFFDGRPENVYLCGFNGVWSPSPEVPDCSPYNYLGNETTCPPGSELKSFAELGDPVCISCPRGMYSTVVNSTLSCMPCPTGTYQDEFGQESCKPCPPGETTPAEAAKTREECFQNEDVASTVSASTEKMTTTQPVGPPDLVVDDETN